MPARPDASSAPQKRTVKLFAAIVVVGLLGASASRRSPTPRPMARRSVAGATRRSPSHRSPPPGSAHRRLRQIRWRRLMKED